jgi:hypothetical protein
MIWLAVVALGAPCLAALLWSYSCFRLVRALERQHQETRNALETIGHLLGSLLAYARDAVETDSNAPSRN